MQQKGRVILIGLSLAVTGCAVATTYQYTKSTGVDEAQLNSDVSDCNGIAEKRTGNREATEVINACMEGKGYAVTKKGLGQYW